LLLWAADFVAIKSLMERNSSMLHF